MYRLSCKYMIPKNISLNGETVLVTGAVGFIGSHLIKRLFQDYPDIHIVGIDSMEGHCYHDASIKARRQREIEQMNGDWTFIDANVADKNLMIYLFHKIENISIVIHLAAQDVIRRDMYDPDVYIKSNLLGFYNVIEMCHLCRVRHLIYASSNAVYGNNIKMPNSEEDCTEHPLSLYAATKKSNELIAYAYSRMYDMTCTGLRFFTVYGPDGRPDMEYFQFADLMRTGSKIDLYNYGNNGRDFLYIDDAVEGILHVMLGERENRLVLSNIDVDLDGPKDFRHYLPRAQHIVYNIGSGQPVSMLDFTRMLADALVHEGVLPKDYNLDSHLNLMPPRHGDVIINSCADYRLLESHTGFAPRTSLQYGLRNFAKWHAENFIQCK